MPESRLLSTQSANFPILADTGVYNAGSSAYERVVVIDSLCGPIRLHLAVDESRGKSHVHAAIWTDIGWKMIHQLAHTAWWSMVPSVQRVKTGQGEPTRTTTRVFEALMDEAWSVIVSAMDTEF